MKKFISVLIGIAILVLPVAVLDATTTAPTVDLITALGTVANVMFAILIALAAAFIIYAGFNFVTAAGDPEKAEKARSAIIFAIIGIVIAILAKGIVAFVQTQFGV